jgi:hypothetical protein
MIDVGVYRGDGKDALVGNHFAAYFFHQQSGDFQFPVGQFNVGIGFGAIVFFNKGKLIGYAHDRNPVGQIIQLIIKKCFLQIRIGYLHPIHKWTNFAQLNLCKTMISTFFWALEWIIKWQKFGF